MKTDKYISELLFTADCVIIPGFGGFITGILPAGIHPGYPIIYPPSKSILFNPKLTQNDGLLVSTVAQGENISYQEALTLITAEVENYKNTLRTEKLLIIEKVGTFHPGDEGNILFEQDMNINYLEDSFGLHNLVCLPLRDEKPELAGEITPIHSQPSLPGLSIRQRVYRVGKVAAIPVFLSLGSLFFYQDLIHDPHISYNSFFLLKHTEKSVKPVQKSKTKTIQINKPVIKQDAEKTVSATAASEKPVVRTTTRNTEKAGVKYFIIGGAFRSIENAEKFVEQLQRKGFKPEIAGATPAGLTLVSCFATTDPSEAEKQLRIIQEKENDQAWILKK